MKAKITILTLTLCIFTSSLAVSSESAKDSSEYKKYISDELIIMAPKDAMELRILPSAISLIESEQIVRNDMKTLKDFTAIVPNFFMPDYGTKLTSPVYIRGIGSRINSPSVGLNVDYVPYFEKAAFDFDMFGVERVEVLRGPQGTLYGRNTMGGIINIFTKSPLMHEGFDVTINAGSHDSYNFGANGYWHSNNERFGASLGLNYVNDGGYFTNKFDGKNPDASRSVGVRLRLIHQPAKYISYENIASFESTRQDGYAYKLQTYDTLSKSFKYGDIDYNRDSYYKRDLFSDAFVIKWNLQHFDLTTISAFQYLKDDNTIDQDFRNDKAVNDYYVSQFSEQKVFSQEFIAKSKYNKTYDWLFGIYGFYQNFDNLVDVKAFKVGNKVSNNLIRKGYIHDIYGGALFHQSTIKINDFIFTGGVRFDYEKDVLDYIDQRGKIDSLGAIVGNVTTSVDTTYKALTSFEVMPKFSLKYEIDYFTNVYAAIARGYKTGGFNSTFERPEDITFDPEKSWNYELGVKLNLENGMFYTDFTLFYIDWKNQQIYQSVPSGRGSMLKNAGESVSKGFEYSLTANTYNGYELNISIGYTDARFTKHINKVKDSVAYDYSNNYIPYVPKWTFAFQTYKLFNINWWLIEGISINAQFKQTGKHFWNEANTSYQESYNTLDFTIGLKNKYLNIDFWAKNITDEEFTTFQFTSLSNSFVQIGKPQRFGIRLTAKI